MVNSIRKLVKTNMKYSSLEGGIWYAPHTSGNGNTQVIKKIGGKDETKRFLENLGFAAGGEVTVVSEISGNMIVSVKEARIAISKAMASRILV